MHKTGEIMDKLIKNIIMLLVWICVVAAPALAVADDITQGQSNKDYLIGPGDVLSIRVWKDEEMHRPTVVVLPDGKISFPLIGDIVAKDKTVATLKKELEEKLNRFIPDPVLTVAVLQVNSPVYIIGKVSRPGKILLSSNLNVLQALSMASGLNSFADRKKIRIFREEGDKIRIFMFNYDDVSKGKSLEQNIQLKRGDVVVVR